MSETLEERKARILRYLQENGEGGFYDFPVAPAINGENSPSAMFDAWSELAAEGKIEYAPRSPENIFMARFRLKMQMRLL